MGKLSTRARKNLPKSEFALPKKNAAGRGSFPINDATHARKAIQLAPRSLHAGNISQSQEQEVVKKAKARLGVSDVFNRARTQLKKAGGAKRY